MTRQLGAFGEQCAADYLAAQGWQIINRNWRCHLGEIDLVARDPETNAVTFIEVKTRSGVGFGSPFESITQEKRARLGQLAAQWMKTFGHPGKIRIDAIGVLKNPGRSPQFSHLKGI